MIRTKVVISMFLFLLLISACSQKGLPAPALQAATEGVMSEYSEPFTLTSSAFQNLEAIPVIYTCDGRDISPPLNWDNPPPSSKSMVLIMDDPDAPVGTWDHWILFNLPPDITNIPEDFTQLPPGTKSGSNSWRKNTYGGPCPPGSTSHRYYFKLYALDTQLNLPEGSKKAAVEKAMKGHILAQTELVGIYRP